MTTIQLLRWGGLAAILAGVLRAVAAFLPSAEPGLALEALYFVTDVCILFGLMALYGIQVEESGRWGLTGFVIATMGIGLLIGPDGALAGVSIYPVGALIFAVGLCVFAVGAWQARKLPRWAPALWVISTLVGSIGFFAPGLGLLFVLSGVAFGLAFAGAGLTVWSAYSPPGIKSAIRPKGHI